MKRVQILLYLSLMAVLYSCNAEYALPSNEFQLIADSFSRSMYGNECLEEGSTALFNVSGGLQMENEILTYQGGRWENEQTYLWDDADTETYLSAVYPAYVDRQYTAKNLYASGELEDILIAKDTLQAKGPIELEFFHLFSLLTIRLDTSLEENLKEMRLTSPVKLVSLDVVSGTFLTEEENQTTVRSKTDTGEYSFILPPAEDCVLTLTLLMEDDCAYEVTIPSHTFKSGYRYECCLVNTDEKPGIRTVEDLKAFCLLVNGETYRGEKTLADFGSEEQGVMIYRLLADLELTAEDCEDLIPIGYNSANPFVAVFDGQGHTISKLVVQRKGTVAGFFGYIQANGVVKDLHLVDCTASSECASVSVGFGFLAGVCYGAITGCSVDNGKVTIDKEVLVGGLVSTLRSGYIINCSVRNTSLTSKGYFGALVGSNLNGSIVNSFSASNTIDRKDYAAGGIVGNSNKGSLLNCYIFKLTLKVKTKCGLLIGTSNQSTINSIFYDSSTTLISESGNDVISEKHPYYQTSFVTTDNRTPICQLLDQWIVGQDSSSYAGFKLYGWTESDNLPAVFK